MQRVVSTFAAIGALAASGHGQLGGRRSPEGGARRGGHAGDRLGAVLGVRSPGGRRPVRLRVGAAELQRPDRAANQDRGLTHRAHLEREALPGRHHYQPGRSRRIGPRPQHVPHPGPAAARASTARPTTTTGSASIPAASARASRRSAATRTTSVLIARTTCRGRRRCSTPGRRARRATPPPAQARAPSRPRCCTT